MENDILNLYKDCFVRNYHKPFIVQQKRGLWYSIDDFINDQYINSHINKDLWAGILAPYYPRWGLIDFDCPDPSIIESTITKLGMDYSEYLLCTSPSYKTDGSIHLLFRPVYNEKPISTRTYLNALNRILNVRRGRVEVFPNQTQGIRLPFGFKQHILENGIPQQHISVMDNIYRFNKIDEFDLKNIIGIEHDSEYKLLDTVTPYELPNLGWKNEGSDLYYRGLFEYRTRHTSILKVTCWLFTNNFTAETTEKMIHQWITTKHNGQSYTINNGNWQEVYIDIHNIVKWVYANYSIAHIYPDVIHNDNYALYECDIEFIAKTFPGDIRNQKRLFRLIEYFRPRMKHENVFCPQTKWIEIASRNNYKEFQDTLIRRDILKVNDSYWVNHYSKSFWMELPDPKNSWLVEKDGRAITEYKDAVLKVYKTPREAIAALRLPKQTIYEWYE